MVISRPLLTTRFLVCYRKVFENSDYISNFQLILLRVNSNKNVTGEEPFTQIEMLPD